MLARSNSALAATGTLVASASSSSSSSAAVRMHTALLREYGKKFLNEHCFFYCKELAALRSKGRATSCSDHPTTTMEVGTEEENAAATSKIISKRTIGENGRRVDLVDSASVNRYVDQFPPRWVSDVFAASRVPLIHDDASNVAGDVEVGKAVVAQEVASLTQTMWSLVTCTSETKSGEMLGGGENYSETRIQDFFAECSRSRFADRMCGALEIVVDTADGEEDGERSKSSRKSRKKRDIKMITDALKPYRCDPVYFSDTHIGAGECLSTHDPTSSSSACCCGCGCCGSSSTDRKHEQYVRVASLVKTLRHEYAATHVVDVGGGQGHFGRFLAQWLGCEVISLDRNVGTPLSTSSSSSSSSSSVDGRRSNNNNNKEKSAAAKGDVNKRNKMPSSSGSNGGLWVMHHHRHHQGRGHHPNHHHDKSNRINDDDVTQLRHTFRFGEERFQPSSSSSSSSKMKKSHLHPCVQPASRLLDIGKLTSHKPTILVGLHTCGFLADEVLEMAASAPNVVAVVCVPCCFHRMAEARWWTQKKKQQQQQQRTTKQKEETVVVNGCCYTPRSAYGRDVLRIAELLHSPLFLYTANLSHEWGIFANFEWWFKRHWLRQAKLVEEAAVPAEAEAAAAAARRRSRCFVNTVHALTIGKVVQDALGRSAEILIEYDRAFRIAENEAKEEEGRSDHGDGEAKNNTTKNKKNPFDLVLLLQNMFPPQLSARGIGIVALRSLSSLLLPPG